MTPEKSSNTTEYNHYNYEYVYPYRIYKGWGKEHRHEICIVSLKKDPNNKIIRFRKRYFGISQKMKIAGETEPRWINRQGFNLNTQKDFPRFFDIIQKFKEGRLRDVNELFQSINFDSQTKHITKLAKSLRVYSGKKRITKQDNIERTGMQEEITRLSEKVSDLNDQNRKLRLQNFKTNTSDYLKVIRNIKSELEKESDNESYFQKKFSENKWIFGPWYENVLPKKMADTSNQPDFVLKRFDGFADIVEIEAPGKPLFRTPNKSEKTQPRSELIQALYQVMNYIDSYNENYTTQFYKDYPMNIENPLNPYKPRGLVIIGRDKLSERKLLRQFNSFLNNVMIITYDEFLHNSESIIQLVSRIKV